MARLSRLVHWAVAILACLVLGTAALTPKTVQSSPSTTAVTSGAASDVAIPAANDRDKACSTLAGHKMVKCPVAGTPAKSSVTATAELQSIEERDWKTTRTITVSPWIPPDDTRTDFPWDTPKTTTPKPTTVTTPKTTTPKPTTLKSTTHTDGIVQACTSLPDGVEGTCIGPTVFVPTATGVCNAHIHETITLKHIQEGPIYWKALWRAEISAYDGNGNSFQVTTAPPLDDWWFPYDNTVVVPKGTALPYDISFDFSANGNANVDWEDNGDNHYLPPGMDWDIFISSPPFNWSSGMTDPNSLPHCEVGGWDPSNEPWDWTKDDPNWHRTNRQMDCRWSCPIIK